ncbi:unnamed protein product [Effrenium voratum]|nr:unnamed protein product [Effrenium voratum]
MAKKGKGGKGSGRKANASSGRSGGKSAKVKQKSRGRHPPKSKTASGKGKSAGKGVAKTGKGAGKSAGKGAGKSAKDARQEGKSTKRKAEEVAEEQGKTILTPKQQRKKEITKLYSDLINPGRTRSADAIVTQIMEALSQRSSTLAEYCSTMIGARVIEACLKWGTMSQRQELLKRCAGDLVKMAQNRYGHQVVLKLALYASKTSKQRKPSEEERKMQAKNLRVILDNFSGKNLHSTFFHRYGCKVINGIYFSNYVKTAEKRRLLHSVAIPQAVALRRPELPSSLPLRKLLRAEDLTEQQKKDIVQHLEEAVEKVIEKELLALDIVHFLFQAFCELATESQMTQLAEQCMDGAAYLLSSKAGAEALLRLLGVANAKQRKAFCRDLKGKWAPLATNSVDYVVMMRVATTVDDTVLLSKTMVAEWIQDMETLCFDKYAHKVLAWLLRPGDAHLFSPYERECLALPAPASQKAPAKRQQELLRTLKPAILGVLLQKPLVAAVDQSAKELLAAYLSSDWDEALIEALVTATVQEAKKEDLGLLNNGTATHSLIVLMKLEPEKGPHLSQQLWERCLRPHLVAAATSRCAFVLLDMLKRDSLKESILMDLRKKKGVIEKALATTEAAGLKVNGAKNLLAEVK